MILQFSARCLRVFALLMCISQSTFAQWNKPLSPFGDERWDDRFLPPGLSNGASPLASHGIGALAAKGSEVYVGGAFTTAGGILANNIAKWDGRRWSALGSGVSGGNMTRVLAIAFHGNEVYVGGDFSSAGGIPANNIARWNGTQWSAVGNGPGGVVNDIAVGPNGEIYVAGSLSLGHIAKWDGNAWSALGGGVSGVVFLGVAVQAIDVAVKGNDVYVCGPFAKAGSVQANQIAKWDGSQWSALGGGITQTNGEWISSVEIFGNNLVAGGLFYSINNVKTNCIATWDGTRWLPMGPANNDGLTGTANDGYWGVWDLAVVGNNLYAAGGFERAGGEPANNLALWNGSTWTALQSSSGRTNQYLAAVAVSGSATYVASWGLLAVGDIVTNSIAKFENGAWSALGSGFDATVQDIVTSASGEVYVGGQFSIAAGVSANRIIKWDGTMWSALGSGLDGTVRALAVRGSEVLAGGNFKTAGGVAASGIAKWDGQSWSALGSGVAGGNVQVNAIAIKGNDIYAGGSFTSAGGVAANNIARWDGANWSALGAGAENGVDAGVNAIAFANSGEVYIGGTFNKAGSVNTKGIAKWNGTSWSPLGSGLSGSLQWVYALASNGEEIYVGGSFTAAGGINSNHIAKWHNTAGAWAAVGAGVGDAASSVNALVLNNDGLFVGGLFAKAGALTVNHLAKWDSNEWSAFDSGLGGTTPDVLALTVFENHVYAGGLFTTAGNKPSFKFAHWQGPTTAVQEKQVHHNRPENFLLEQNYPNPFNPTTVIRYELPKPAQVQLAIYNLLGERVRTLVDAKESAGVKQVTWDGRNGRGERVSSGVYLYRLEAGEFSTAKRLLLMK